MPNETSDPKTTEKKKQEIEVRDLKPKKDAQGGAGNPDNQTSRRTGEVDFMKGWK